MCYRATTQQSGFKRIDMAKILTRCGVWLENLSGRDNDTGCEPGVPTFTIWIFNFVDHVIMYGKSIIYARDIYTVKV